jgi:hypothetical protein
MPRTETLTVQANPRDFVLPRPPEFALTSPGRGSIRMAMKSLALALFALCGLTAAQTTPLVIDGEVSWKIAKPDCTFRMDGSIQNPGPDGTASGTLKLVLWATLLPFPSGGHVVSELNLGSLPGGYEIADFSRKAAVDMPPATGEFHFTVALLEYTVMGWRTIDYFATGKRAIKNGDFVTGSKWAVPSKKPAGPPSSLAPGDVIKLNIRSNSNMDGITPGTEAPFVITAKSGGKAQLKFGSRSSTVPYTYTTGKGTLNGVNYKTGKLTLDKSTNVTLFFHGPHTGVYRQNAPSRTTWGIFRFD